MAARSSSRAAASDIPVHHVFRDRERAASMAAFEAGLSPEIVHAEHGITVLRFIDGRTFGEADLRANVATVGGAPEGMPHQGRPPPARSGQHVLGVPRHPRLRPPDRRRPALPRHRRPARAGAGAHADRVRPPRPPARQLHGRRPAPVADRLGVRRLRHGDVRSRQPVVEWRVRCGRGRCAARCLFCRQGRRLRCGTRSPP